MMTPQFFFAQRAIQQVGPNYYVAGLRSSEFSAFAAKQNCMNWCWAASIQSVLNFHGLYVSQFDIVTRIYGRPVCLTADGVMIMNALKGWAPDFRGRWSQIYSQYGVYNDADIVDNLSRKWPIIVGVQNQGGGHVYVMTAVYYSLNRFNSPVIDKVMLRDPWPGSQSCQEWRWSFLLSRSPEFIKVWVNRL